jgi:hypothetical protein
VIRRLFRARGLPRDFTGELTPDEAVLAVASVRGGGYLVVSTLGLWLPDGRRLGWHLVSKATWRNGVLTVVEARETGTVGPRGADDPGRAVLLADRPPVRFALADPGKVPETVHARVTGSIRSRHHRDLPGGGAWFVQRKVPGMDGIVLQVRPDPGTEPAAVAALAAEVVGRVGRLPRDPGA